MPQRREAQGWGTKGGDKKKPQNTCESGEIVEKKRFSKERNGQDEIKSDMSVRSRNVRVRVYIREKQPVERKNMSRRAVDQRESVAERNV